MAAIDVVDWIGIAADAAVATGASRIGLLATSGMIASKAYQLRLADAGIQAIVPDPDFQGAIMEAVYGSQGIKAAGPGAAAVGLLTAIAAHLVEKGAESLLLGCTEIPIAMAGKDIRWQIPAIDPSTVVALAVCERARSPKWGEHA
jgi:aspartate racemase